MNASANSQKWLSDLWSKIITIKYKFSRSTNFPTFRILCAEPIRSATTEFTGTYDLLKSWGIFGLSSKGAMEFVVAYEARTEKKIGDYEMSATLVREIRLPHSASLRISM
jgi:hypothetical protein